MLCRDKDKLFLLMKIEKAELLHVAQYKKRKEKLVTTVLFSWSRIALYTDRLHPGH